ncbi:hypothetical protein J437_LFUL010648 [Ladona fulva]|uniref:PiggyBac transposable element-derived protein domain-containing protein n=1 Tax=Ladona fulva TaxID=123851 RepID=A0A8K0KRV8_LADFU|nr:hypothetical protein J437_LFUL010648 [Ladona fulva]
MTVYLGKDRLKATKDITATQAVKYLTRRLMGSGHKLMMDNFFSSADLFDELKKSKINCCETVRPIRSGMPKEFQNKKLKLKRGDIKVRTRNDLTAIVWKDKRDVHVLTNMHAAPAEGNFCNDQGRAIKPAIVEDYNRHMGYVDKSDRMANSYSISRRTWKWTKKLFFHLLDLTILNAYITLSSVRSGMSHRSFRLALLKNLLEPAGKEKTIAQRSRGRPSPVSTNIGRLEGGK